MAFTPLEKAMCQLFTGAFFFAMRSCEYLQVSGTCRTKILKLKNIRFFNEKKELHHKDNYLKLADTVSITFEFQKKDTCNDTITHFRSGHKSICPVLTWCSIVQRIRAFDNSNDESTINTFMDKNNKLHKISGRQMLAQIRLAAAAIGKDKLGFTPKEIGLHSARCGAAMAMYLSGVLVCTIMLLGRWSSNAFLRYIRKQINEFSKGISSKMLTNKNSSQFHPFQIVSLSLIAPNCIFLRKYLMAYVSMGQRIHLSKYFIDQTVTMET
jgi:hypothetical protein